MAVVLNLHGQCEGFIRITQAECGVEISAAVPRLILDADLPVLQTSESDLCHSTARNLKPLHRADRPEREGSAVRSRRGFDREIQIERSGCPFRHHDREIQPLFAAGRHDDGLCGFPRNQHKPGVDGELRLLRLGGEIPDVETDRDRSSRRNRIAAGGTVTADRLKIRMRKEHERGRRRPVRQARPGGFPAYRCQAALPEPCRKADRQPGPAAGRNRRRFLR